MKYGMTQILSEDYDAYAYVILHFGCGGCKKEIEVPDSLSLFDEGYCDFIARIAEADRWYIDCGTLVCFCPECRQRAGL
jgi:hypothetical protein